METEQINKRGSFLEVPENCSGQPEDKATIRKTCNRKNKNESVLKKAFFVKPLQYIQARLGSSRNILYRESIALSF